MERRMSRQAQAPSDDGLLSLGFGLPDLRPPRIEKCCRMSQGSRLNLVIPGISEEVSFGGINTALRFFESLATEFEFLRIVVTMESQSRFEPIAGIGGWSMREVRRRAA